MCPRDQWNCNTQDIYEPFTAWTWKCLTVIAVLNVYVCHTSILQSLEETEQKTPIRRKRWKESAKQSKLVQELTLNCIQRVSGSDLDWYTDSCGYIFHDFPQSLHKCTNVVRYIIPWALSFTDSVVHCSQSFKAVHPELMTVSSNKLQINEKVGIRKKRFVNFYHVYICVLNHHLL